MAENCIAIALPKHQTTQVPRNDDLLSELEALAKNRYTQEDDEYMKEYNRESPPAPLVAPEARRQRFNRGRGDWHGASRGRDFYHNNRDRDDREGCHRNNREGYDRSSFRDNRSGYQRDYRGGREGYPRDNRDSFYQRDNRDGFHQRDNREGFHQSDNNRDGSQQRGSEAFNAGAQQNAAGSFHGGARDGYQGTRDGHQGSRDGYQQTRDVHQGSRIGGQYSSTYPSQDLR